MAEESLNKVFAELVPGRTCSRIVRVDRVPGVAVVDHVGKFLEVAEAALDGAGGKDYLFGCGHLFHALLLMVEIIIIINI